MIFIPNLKDYKIEVLIALLNKETDENSKNNLKELIMEKILKNNYPTFYLIHKFKNSTGIIKEIYADIILNKINNHYDKIPPKTIDELLEYASLDALIHSGANSDLENFNQLCKKEFYSRSLEIENKNDLHQKKICFKNKKISKGSVT